MQKQNSPTNAIEIRSLRVDYGDFTAVHDLDLCVPRGEVLGLVGPNGAGKTSTFRVIATLLTPTYGEVIIDGVDALTEPEKARHKIGYMPDLAPVPSDLKVDEFLLFYAQAYGLGTRADCLRRVDECLDAVSLQSQRKSWCSKMSRGQTQRLILAKTMLHRPSIMILDEPASGLDPLARRELRQSVRNMADLGTTVIISSHILSELSEMCTSLCVMGRGRKFASGSVESVRKELSSHLTTLTLKTISEPAEWENVLRACPGVSNASQMPNKAWSISFNGTAQEQANLITQAVACGVKVRSFEEKHSSYEDILIQIAENERSV